MLIPYKQSIKKSCMLCVGLLLASCHWRLRPMDETRVIDELLPVWVDSKLANDYFLTALERALRCSGVIVLGGNEYASSVGKFPGEVAQLIIERPTCRMRVPVALGETGADKLVVNELEIRMTLRLPDRISSRGGAKVKRLGWSVEQMSLSSHHWKPLANYCMESMEYECLVDKAVAQLLPELLNHLEKRAE